jgi:hypothetical protein
VEKGGRKGDAKQRGYVHRLDQVATSFFFTNFPEDVKAVDLWPKFARFGRVGEVFIPDKLDRQGRRFGFVKYRDMRNAREQLDLVSNIWIGIQEDEEQRNERLERKWKWREKDGRSWNKQENGREWKSWYHVETIKVEILHMFLVCILVGFVCFLFFLGWQMSMFKKKPTLEM